ncbi:MAG TPA: NUDIX hydrolase [Terriglobales bacterium]|nr:NUDIX hydrolase [Terriglobales bacterium]
MAKTAKKNKLVKLVESKEVYRGPVFHVTSDTIVEPGRIKVRRDVVRHTGSVVIMAVDDEKPDPRVLLARQYRHPANDYLWELPAGRIDPGEDPVAGARRELEEETGYSAARWKRALFYWASPGFLDETMSVYLATGLKRGRARPEEDENIAIRMLPLSTLVKGIMAGRIRDGKTIAGGLWLERHYRRR